MRFYNALFIRVFILIGLTGSGIYVLVESLHYTALLLLAIIALFCAELYHFIKSRMLFYDKILLSILHDDFSAVFPPTHKSGNFAHLFRLYEHLKKERFQQQSRELVYTSILNNVETSILILQSSDDGTKIFLMNDCFSKLFNVPKFSEWQFLKNQLPSFCNEIESHNFTDVKTTVSIKPEHREAQTFMMQTSRTKSVTGDYYIILLDSIQNVIARKEKDAWINLMKVISHELMNSLTPIRSLSHSLQEIVTQPELSADDLQDIRQSLTTIINRSDHLQFFVENYRKLSMLPTPIKEPADLNLIVAECLQVMSPLLKAEHIEVSNSIDIPKMIAVDRQQFEQVIINLITNSMHALKEHHQRQIFISSSVEDNRVFITIADTGEGIEPEIREKIFVPFFTTRKDGAGIGLTLSRNIIEAHGGYLAYTDGATTSFTICLIAN